MDCLHKKFCVLGGSGCDDGNNCGEKMRLDDLAQQKCPIMLKLNQTAEKKVDEKLYECDVPLFLRALIPGHVSCTQGTQCIFAKYFPQLRSEGYAGKLNYLTRKEIAHLSAEIKTKLRSEFPQQQLKLGDTTKEGQGSFTFAAATP